MSHAMSPGPWSRIKRKTDPLPSPPASLASFTSTDSSSSSCSSSSSSSSSTSPSSSFAPPLSPSLRHGSTANANNSGNSSTATSSDSSVALVTCAPRPGDGDNFYSHPNAGSLLINPCHEFHLQQQQSHQLQQQQQSSTHRPLLLIQKPQLPQQPPQHLPKSGNCNLYQSHSHQAHKQVHMPNSPHHQLHPASLLSGCEIDFGPGGTIRRKPSIHLNNPKLPLVSATTRILANQSGEDSRVEIVPSTTSFSSSCSQITGQHINLPPPLSHRSAIHPQISEDTYSTVDHTSRSHTLANSTSTNTSNVTCIDPYDSPCHASLCENSIQVPSVSSTSSASLTSQQATHGQEASTTQQQLQQHHNQQQPVLPSSTATVIRSASTIVRNNIQYGTLKRNNSSVNGHRIPRRVSNFPTTGRTILPFESMTVGERVSLASLNSVESSGFSSGSSSSASSVCSSSSRGTNSPPSLTGKTNSVLVPLRSAASAVGTNGCNLPSQIISKVCYSTSNLGGGVNLPVTSSSSSSSFHSSSTTCNCSQVSSTGLPKLNTGSIVSGVSFDSSGVRSSTCSFTSSSICKSCASETSSILSRSVSMLGEEESECKDDPYLDETSTIGDDELNCIENSLVKLNLVNCLHQQQQINSMTLNQVASDATASPKVITTSSNSTTITTKTNQLVEEDKIKQQLAKEAKQFTLRSNNTDLHRTLHPPHNTKDGMNQCHAKNSCNSNSSNSNSNSNNNQRQLSGNMNNGLVSSNKQPCIIRDSWSYVGDGSSDASDDEEGLPPPPSLLDDSRMMARLSNLSLDSLPPPPPLELSHPNLNVGHALTKSESRYSLDSFPPPPPPVDFTSSCNGNNDSQSLPRSLGPSPPPPLPPLQIFSSTAHQFYNKNHFSHFTGASVKRQEEHKTSNTLNNNNNNNNCISSISNTRSKVPPPPPPKRSESTKLSSQTAHQMKHQLLHQQQQQQQQQLQQLQHPHPQHPQKAPHTHYLSSSQQRC